MISVLPFGEDEIYFHKCLIDLQLGLLPLRGHIPTKSSSIVRKGSTYEKKKAIIEIEIAGFFRL